MKTHDSMILRKRHKYKHPVGYIWNHVIPPLSSAEFPGVVSRAQNGIKTMVVKRLSRLVRNLLLSPVTGKEGLCSRWPFKNFLLIFTLSLCPSVLVAQDTTIRLRQGFVQGVAQESNNRPIYAFLGIPYAKPPTGELRFKPPQRHDGWTTTLYANEFGAACPQPFLTGVKISEDCLFLNVWIPELPRMSRQYPVVVMLEGELFVTSSPSRFPGEDLAAYDVIVVSVNYRTNAFGFLSWQDGMLPGNLGLRDQSLALQWVAENIDMFGGDPARVTLLGHSAGAASAAYHLVHPAGQGPFQQMILLSGSNLAPWALSRRPQDAARRLSEHLGCGSVYSSTYILACLKGKDANQIVKAVERLIEEGNPYYLFSPVVDDFLPHGERMVPVEPLRAIRENANRRIPVLVGLSEMDGSVFLHIKREIVHMTYDDLTRYGKEILVPLVTILSMLGEDADEVNRIIEYAYLDKAPAQDKDMLVLEIVKMFSDGLYKAPIVKFAEEIARRGLATYFLVNEFLSRDVYDSHTNISGALHGTDMIYLFAPTAYRQAFNAQLTFGEERIRQNIQRIVSTYASNGNPYLGQYSPRWERFTPEDPKYASLESSQMHQGYQHHLVAFWNQLLPDLVASRGGRTTSPPTTGTGNPSVTDSQSEPPLNEPSQYQPAVWTLVAIILLLVGAIITYIVCAKRRKRLNSGTLHDQ